MSSNIDESLLSRLRALRASSATPEKPSSNPIKFDAIERAKTPTKGDALAARLKHLRSSPPSAKSTPTKPRTAESEPAKYTKASTSQPSQLQDDVEVDALFETDDKALEEMLADVDIPTPEPESKHEYEHEPREEDVKALLEQLSASIPQDSDAYAQGKGDSDDSDGEKMSREVDDVIARFKDEIELDAPEQPQRHDEPPSTEEADADLALPSVPSNLDMPEPSQKAHGIDDITARMAALRAPAADADNTLPSVPTSKPSKRVDRLTSRTNYTDDDVDSWCTVCLEDATLRCLGCDGDVYCARCWREMHVGPAAAWDDRSHKAVQFTREGDGKKVALGA